MFHAFWRLRLLEDDAMASVMLGPGKNLRGFRFRHTAGQAAAILDVEIARHILRMRNRRIVQV
jgi:hypothetical protein